MAHLSIRCLVDQVKLEAFLTTSVTGEAFHILLPDHVADPTDNVWKEIRWYLEDYARRDPFSFSRAQSAERSLRSYGLSLALAISKSDATLTELKDSSLLISVEFEGESTLRMARILWEVLEDAEIWPENRRPSSVSVIRRTKPNSERNALKVDFTSKEHPSQHNLLAITARPGREHDIPHRLVTRSILGIVQDRRVPCQDSSSFQLVRPGTFEALRSSLHSHDVGHFDVIHLDMHGLVRNGQAFLRFIRGNEDLDGENDIPASDVAKLLAKRGVRYAIMNACQSASEEGPISSAARTMIQEGLWAAIGMRYEILDSAVDIFARNFYHHYVKNGAKFLSAAHIGRFALQIKPNRRTRFNTDVQVKDYVTPIVAVNADLDICDLRSNNDGSTSALVPGEQVNICGREGNILSLETKTAISNVLLIRASAGTGKTFLAQHLCWWWKATGYVEDFVQINCTMLDGKEVHRIREKIDRGLGISSTHGSNDVETYLKEHRCLIVIDSLDALHMKGESYSSQKAMRRFLHKIKNSTVLLLSRFEEQWVQTVARVVYPLNNLDMKASLQLATREAKEPSPELPKGDKLDLRFLEQCVRLVDGNALAISMLMKQYNASCDLYRLLYHKLTNGSVLNSYGQDDCEEDHHRGFIDARHLVRHQTGTSRAASLRDDDFRILAPFWRSFPANLACYPIFFQLAKARVTYDNEVVNIPYSWLRVCIEAFSAGEFDVAAGGQEFPASKTSSLRSLEPAFRLCEDEGFMCRSDDDSVRIHPLMTLVLRSQPFALPEWAAHLIQVAFHRFVSYQTRHWPTGTSFLEDPKVQKALDATFPNYATACNFSLAMKANYPNCILFNIIHFSVYRMQRRAPLVLDICDRFLEVFGLPLARNRPSVAQNVLKWITKIGGSNSVANQRGILEMACLNAIHFADVAAELLDVQHNNSELLEGIAKNLQHDSNYYEANLKLLAAAKTRLARHQCGDQDRTSAMKDIFNIDDAVFDVYKRHGLGAQTGSVDHDLGRRIGAVEVPEEIDSIEQELLGLLEQQLDGIDAAERKAVIYESLAVLDLKRERYEDAFQHIDTATNLFRPFRQNKPRGWESLVDERCKILAMSKPKSAKLQNAGLITSSKDMVSHPDINR